MGAKNTAKNGAGPAYLSHVGDSQPHRYARAGILCAFLTEKRSNGLHWSA